MNDFVDMPPVYTVTINKNSKNEVTGKIEIVGTKKTMEFNPLNILSNLSCSEEKTPLPEDIKAADYEYEYGFGKKFGVFNAGQYIQTIMYIKYLFKHIEAQKPKNKLTLNHIELMKSYLGIYFKFYPQELLSNELKPVYDLMPAEPTYPPASSLPPAIDFDFKGCQDFFYICYFASDILYSILHFLAFNEYRINKCPHCEKYFATHTLKQKYCTGYSPCLGHLRCEQAVRNITQTFTRNHDKIYHNLYSNSTLENLNDFEKEYYKILPMFKENPTLENIDLCLEALNKDRWSKKQIIKTVGQKSPHK